jgi:hypothetical protein
MVGITADNLPIKGGILCGLDVDNKHKYQAREMFQKKNEYQL